MPQQVVLGGAGIRPAGVVIAFAALWLAPPILAQEDPMTLDTTAHLVPADKGFPEEQIAALYRRGEQRVYTGDARTTIGMPCGGVCAGQLYVRGDGTLGCWQIDGGTYFSGHGRDNYRTFRPDQQIAQGFAVAVRDRGGRATRATLDDAGYDAIEFVGEYPRALIRYRNVAAERKDVGLGGPALRAPPVQVDLEVFSPFIPLNAKDSAYPATVLRFTLTNPSANPLDVAVGGWLENMVFSEHSDPITIRRRNRAISGGLTSVQMDAVEHRLAAPPGPPTTRVLADFESGTYQGWTVSGAAFGEAPSTGTQPSQQDVTGFSGGHLVNSYHDPDRDQPTGKMVSDPFDIELPYLTFRIGGGEHESKTCLNLVVDGKVVRTATGRNNEKLEPRLWDVSEFVGHQAHLEIVDEHSGHWGHINVDDIALTNAIPDELREYNQDALGFGKMALSLIGDGDGVPQWPGKDEFVEGLEWAMPHGLPGSETAEGGFDKPLVGTVKSVFSLRPGESREVTFIVSWYFPNLHTEHGRMYTNWFEDSVDVARKLASDLPHLRQETIRFCDAYYRDTTLPWWLASRLMMPVSNLATGTAQWWRDGRFWAWEGVGCCSGTCTHVWNYAQAHAWLFPELARSARSMQDLGEGFDETTGLVGFRSNRAFAADGQAGTVLKCYREHLTSGDDRFLREHWPRAKMALEYLISHDLDDDGIIENDQQHNTYDINFSGPNTFVGGLYLAALRAGEEMAGKMDDTQAAERYRRIFERGREWTAKNLFNGEYFEQRLPMGSTMPWQYATGCLSDQVFGQTWAHVNGLGYVYPPQQVRSALAAVYKYNWVPDVGPLNEEFPPERWFARPGEPGLFLCTWPRGGRPEKPVRYRDEIWTGIEYQVAAGLLREGMTDEALLIVHGIDRRYDGVKHNPWNEVECGDHYARALASWSVLHALAGFTCDVPAGRLGFAPRIQKDDFACFFCAGTGWGTLKQRRGARDQTNAVVLRVGALRLTELDLEAPPDEIAAVEVTVIPVTDDLQSEQKRDATATKEGGRWTVRFEQPIELSAGEELQVVLRW